MNVEIGTEAAQFPEKEYINGISLAVQTVLQVHKHEIIFGPDQGYIVPKARSYRIFRIFHFVFDWAYADTVLFYEL